MATDPATKEYLSPGAHIFSLRKALGYNQQDFAKAANISRKTLWMIEILGHNPLYDTKRKIVRPLGKKVHEIWPEETDD